jgi:hypothetical protein
MNNQEFNTRDFDIAYGSFLFCGVVALSISVLSYIPMDSGTAGVMGFLVFIPLSLASLAAIVVGIVLAIKLYHHWQLIILSVLSVMFVAEMITEYGSVMFYNMVPIFYGVITCAFSLVWFGILRKRDRNA